MNSKLFQNTLRPGLKQPGSCRPPAVRFRAAFTLIELLVVIAVIAILAALIFPVVGAVNKAKVRSRARAELVRLEAAIGAYKVQMGFFPPSDTNRLVPNSLYYELVGTTSTVNNGAPVYKAVHESTLLPATALPNTFGPRIGGFMNCTRGSGDEGVSARQFLNNLRPDQFLEVSNPPSPSTFIHLGSRAVDGPLIFQSDEETPRKLNPWRYNSAKPIHNTGSYDLWIDVKIGSKVYRVNNWGKEYEIQDPYKYWP